MRLSLKQAMRHTAVVGAIALTGCSAFNMGNPFVPAARILVTAQPQLINSHITYVTGESRFSYANDLAAFNLGPYPGDTTPGVLFTDYTIRFLDQAGTEISSLLIPQRRLAATVYVPRGSGSSTGGAAGAASGAAAASSGTSISVPAISEAVTRYAATNGFRNTGTDTAPVIMQNSNPWNQNITGEITFYGKDDDQYPIQAVGTFTVNFITGISATDPNASGTGTGTGK